MNVQVLMMAGLLASGCTKSECISDDGCDTAVEEAEPVGAVDVAFDWVTPAAFEVVMYGLGSAKLGIAETGLGGTGYYLEDCVSPNSKCHPISEGANTLISRHQNATGEAWDGTLDDGETALHQASEENLTYAVWTLGGECVAVSGHDVDFFAPHDCVNLP
jgi:hypothetical protein